MDGGAWWAAVHGVARSRTRLKRLSSSSSRRHIAVTVVVIVQSLSCVGLFETPWTAARQTSLSITNSWSLLKLMSIESVLPSNHLHFCRPLLLLPSSLQALGSFPMSWLFTSGGQSIGASASVLLIFRVDSVIYNAPKLKQQVTVQITGCYFSFVAM